MKYTVPLAAALVAVAAAGCQAAAAAPDILVAQTGVGAPYGSRDPYACSSKTFPKNGALTADMARQYVICEAEGEDNRRLWLLENVTVQVGKGVVTHYITKADQDPNGAVYALRGSLDQYLCRKVQHGEFENAGKNCVLYRKSDATGKCYRTTFGDWACSMNALGERGIDFQPPPKD